MSSCVCINSKANSQSVSWSVPSYPVQWTKYNNWHFLRLSILESRISDISNSMFSLTLIGGGGGWSQFGMVFQVVGSSWEMWNTGWMACSCSGSQRVNESCPTCAIMSNGPKFFSDSFFEGLVVQKYVALMKMKSPILKSGAVDRRESAGPW